MRALADRMTYAEYSAFEREATDKHEYLRGEIYAMTGGTLQHANLAGQLIYLLKGALAGGPCRVLTSDARVRVEATDLDTYPDVSVVCGEPQTAAEDRHALINPTLLVEVLSDSTEAYDRGQKSQHYRRIPSLKAYLLVAQHEPRLELMVRQANETWTFIEAGAGQTLTIMPLNIELRVDEVYERPIP